MYETGFQPSILYAIIEFTTLAGEAIKAPKDYNVCHVEKKTIIEYPTFLIHQGVVELILYPNPMRVFNKPNAFFL